MASKKSSDDQPATATRSIFHRNCLQKNQQDYHKASTRGTVALVTKIRDLEEKLNAVMNEFELKRKKYDATIIKITNDFRAEQQILNARLCDEREAARRVESLMKNHQSTIVAEQQDRISKLQLENQLKDDHIHRLKLEAVETKEEITQLRKKFQERTGFGGIENIRAHQMFDLLDKYIAKNSKSWSEVERICAKSNDTYDVHEDKLIDSVENV